MIGSLDGAAVGAARRRFAYVGTGGRARTFIDPVALRFAQQAAVVGLCDSSLVRVRYHQRRLREQLGYGPEVPIYPAAAFTAMLAEVKPDQVVVCTVDSEHDRYIVQSLEAGCDVVTEKPLTIDFDRCRRIQSAVKNSGRSVRVAFNYRWGPGPTKVKELLAAGAIGTVRHVNLEYLLNTHHGADYFRRWHASKAISGGLLVHKATHHFDLVNWWLDGIPERVYAHGGLCFYGRENAVRRGDAAFARHPRAHGYPEEANPFAYQYSASLLGDPKYEEELYLAAEAESGYIRDRNVFRDGIDIEDVMSVMVRYRHGASLSYSLNAFSPYEGYRVSFTGDRGRIEYDEWHGAHLPGQPPGGAAQGPPFRQSLTLHPHFAAPTRIDLPALPGGHGGADPRMLEQIFAVPAPEDRFGRSAGHEQGIASAAVGIAANECLQSGLPVDISQRIALVPDALQLSQLR